MEYARRILQLNDEAYASMSEEVLTGFVRLGVPLDFFGRDFVAWLARFKAKHPMVRLEVEANQSEGLSARGDFDLAFFKQEAGANFGMVTLREQLVWVGGPSYRRRRRGISVTHSASGSLYISPLCRDSSERAGSPLASELRQPKLRMPEGRGGRGHGNNGPGPRTGCAAAQDHPYGKGCHHCRCSSWHIPTAGAAVRAWLLNSQITLLIVWRPVHTAPQSPKSAR
jgi:DNA-binding transcriptional LysR family regulator